MVERGTPSRINDLFVCLRIEQFTHAIEPCQVAASAFDWIAENTKWPAAQRHFDFHWPTAESMDSCSVTSSSGLCRWNHSDCSYLSWQWPMKDSPMWHNLRYHEYSESNSTSSNYRSWGRDESENRRSNWRRSSSLVGMGRCYDLANRRTRLFLLALNKEFTVDRIIFDSIFIGPTGTSNGEQSGGWTIEWRNRTGPILWGSIDLEVQCTGTDLGWKSIGHFESPMSNLRIGNEQLTNRREITGTPSYNELSIIEDHKGRAELFTEKPNILIWKHLTEPLPLDAGQGSVESLIDRPSDVRQRRARFETTWEEGDLCCRINQLKFLIRDTHTCDNTTESRREVLSSEEEHFGTDPITTICGWASATETRR